MEIDLVRVILHDHTKKRNSGLFFFFGLNFGSKWPKKIAKNVEMYLLEKYIYQVYVYLVYIIYKRPMLFFFVWS